jgi:hypothetical protein
MHTIRLQCSHRFNTCYPESYRPIHWYFGGTVVPIIEDLYSDLFCKSTTNNGRCNYYMENKMTSLKTYLCVLKMFDAKIYLWHLQGFLISGAKIKLHFNWRLTKIPWRNIWCIGVPWDGNSCTKLGPLRFSQFSDCWLILSVCWLMSFAFPFGRLLGVR